MLLSNILNSIRNEELHEEKTSFLNRNFDSGKVLKKNQWQKNEIKRCNNQTDEDYEGQTPEQKHL